jgi:hypothetical protein
MAERVARTKDDSDTAYFFDLLYLGELVLKTTVVALAGSLADDPERHRYRGMPRPGTTYAVDSIRILLIATAKG